MIKNRFNVGLDAKSSDQAVPKVRKERSLVFRVGKTWHYRFCVAGVRIQRSTRLQDRAIAEKLALKAYQDACVVAAGGQITPTLSELVTEWLKVHSRIVSKSHFSSVETFCRLHLQGLGGVLISDLNTERVETARNAHLTSHSPATANHWLRLLTLVVNWAVRREIIPALPWKVSKIKVQQRPRPVLPINKAGLWFAELDRVTAKSPWVGLAVKMMFAMGLRESEAAGSRWEWFDWERCTYTPGESKGRESVAIPVPKWLINVLQSFKKSEGLVCCGRNGMQLPPGFAARPMATVNAIVGTPGITPHRLRGTYATLLADHGTPIQTIQHVLRHKDVKTTMAYLTPAISSAFSAIERIGQSAGLAQE